MKNLAKEILQEKIAMRINNGKEAAVNNLRMIVEQAAEIDDYIVSVGEKTLLDFVDVNGSVKLQLPSGHIEATPGLLASYSEFFTLHNNAVTQIAEKYQIGAAYLRSLCSAEEQWKTNLATTILNTHNQRTDRQRVLLRTISNTVKAVLSDNYRRLNTSEVFTAFNDCLTLPECRYELYSCHAADLNSYAEAISPEITTIEMPDGSEVDVCMGLRMSSSDFGVASLEIKRFVVQVVCLNGLTKNTILRKVHLGSKLPADITMSDETYRLDTMAICSAVKDTVKELCSPKSLISEIDSIKSAFQQPVNYEAVFVRLSKAGKLYKPEIEEAKNILNESRIDDGIINRQETTWNLAQAISAVARKQEKTRERQLQEIAGELIA